ncbi:MAG: L,D-transpeptidase [Cyanobacteria bacterium P01_D01_bin.116]
MMKNSINFNSLKSQMLAIGALMIGASGANFINVQPAFANTSEQFSGAGIVFDEQAPRYERASTKKNWRVILKGTTNSPKWSPREYQIPNQPITEEVHLVVKLGARQVQVYRGNAFIKSYPIAVGKPGYETPEGSFNVFSKEIDPIFKNFKTGVVMKPGKNNPLGSRWIGVWTDGKTQIGFHGTNRPQTIGRAASHGCIRMHDKDVIELYEKVEIGTLVKVEL